MIATKANSPLSRPLCAYPQLPRYRGAGNPNDAASFECAAP
jgi:feruloyl esterase